MTRKLIQLRGTWAGRLAQYGKVMAKVASGIGLLTIVASLYDAVKKAENRWKRKYANCKSYNVVGSNLHVVKYPDGWYDILPSSDKEMELTSRGHYDCHANVAGRVKPDMSNVKYVDAQMAQEIEADKDQLRKDIEEGCHNDCPDEPTDGRGDSKDDKGPIRGLGLSNICVIADPGSE